MLFAHGFGCDQTLWRFVAPSFEDRYRVITFDYIGAGASDRAAYNPARYSTLNGYADDILEICRVLDLRDIVLVAHSVSATIAMLAAIADPAGSVSSFSSPRRRAISTTSPSIEAGSPEPISTACSR